MLTKLMKKRKCNKGNRGCIKKVKDKIKKNQKGRRSNFRSRHNCDNPGPKTKARYWSCKAW